MTKIQFFFKQYKRSFFFFTCRVQFMILSRRAITFNQNVGSSLLEHSDLVYLNSGLNRFKITRILSLFDITNVIYPFFCLFEYFTAGIVSNDFSPDEVIAGNQLQNINYRQINGITTLQRILKAISIPGDGFLFNAGLYESSN